jgi:HK97 family phage portal protein
MDMKIEEPSLFDRFKYLMTGSKRYLYKSYEIGSFLNDWKLGKPVFTDWDMDNAVAEGYKACGYVYACIYKIMKSMASVPWHAEVRDAEGWERVDEHPLSLLLSKPNDFMDMQDYMERIVAHLFLGGNSINKLTLGISDGKNIPLEMWPLYPDNIKPVPDREKYIRYYEYNANSIKKNFDVEEIIQIQFVDPENPYWGCSPLKSGGRVIDTDIEAVKWNKVALENRAVTDGVFSVKEFLTKDQWTLLREQIADQHQGSDVAREPWLLSGGASWQQMSLSPVEMDWIQSRKMNREDICSMLGVPPPLIGFYDDATLNNIQTARRIFWEDTIIPLMDDVRGAFNLGFQRFYGPDVRATYDISNVPALREDFVKKVESAQKLWQMGIPFNEINQRLELGFDEISGGDIGYMPANLLPAGGVADLVEEGKAISGADFGEVESKKKMKKTV